MTNKSKKNKNKIIVSNLGDLDLVELAIGWIIEDIVGEDW